MALSDNLISYWKCDEASGDLNDSHGVNDFSSVGTPTWGETGKINDAVGTDLGDYFATGSDSSIDTGAGADITWAGWVKPITPRDYGGIFAKVHPTNDSDQSFMFVQMANSKLNANKGGAWTGESTGTISTNVWSHVAFVVSSGTQYFYINGTVDASSYSFSQADYDTGVWRFGRWYNAATTYDGTHHIDEAGFWSRALSGSEISELYNGGTGISYEDIAPATTFNPRVTWFT